MNEGYSKQNMKIGQKTFCLTLFYTEKFHLMNLNSNKILLWICKIREVLVFFGNLGNFVDYYL